MRKIYPSVASVADPATAPPGEGKIEIRSLAKALIKYNASDLHLKAGRPPLYRINGNLVSARTADLTPDQIEGVVFGLLTAAQMELLKQNKQVDLSFKLPDMGRFRCNAYYQRGTLSAAIRMIPMEIPRLEELGVPPVLKELCQRNRGLLLITGSTGAGKSTTLAGMIHHINESRSVHIVSIEDPIEFVHTDIRASISQREVGADTNSFSEALRAGLRQDPDVIIIGEMRDKDTIQAALTAAETGHLVISTLHTNDAKSTIDRILDVFPADGQDQIRIQLAHALVAVVCQQLVMRADKSGLVLASEVMVKSPVIESYILKNEREKIPEAIAGSNTYYNMQTMNMALEKLVKRKIISLEEALKSSNNPDDLKLRLQGITRDEGYGASGGYGVKKVG